MYTENWLYQKEVQ